MVTKQSIQQVKDKALTFLTQLECENEFRLFARSETTPYARCFSIFSRALCRDNDWLELNNTALIEGLNQGFSEFFSKRKTEIGDIRFDKPILQLLCFTLSALHITRGNLSPHNKEILKDYLSSNLLQDFNDRGVFAGSPGSGNYAMFRAILLHYGKHYLDIDCDAEIMAWIESHLSNVNKHGFWGKVKSMQYLQFQNGYHQYEIFEFMGVSSAPWITAARNTIKFADTLGHFAPYPGGGGCYDYDAIFMLTSPFVGNIGQNPIVSKTLNTILDEQNLDGGFCESKFIRSTIGLPRPLALFLHILKQPSQCRLSSAIHGANLFRPKHRRVRTHWCETDRNWNESNAWDTFFRLSLIARATQFLDLPGSDLFKINHFPGIG